MEVFVEKRRTVPRKRRKSTQHKKQILLEKVLVERKGKVLRRRKKSAQHNKQICDKSATYTHGSNVSRSMIE